MEASPTTRENTEQETVKEVASSNMPEGARLLIWKIARRNSAKLGVQKKENEERKVIMGFQAPDQLWWDDEKNVGLNIQPSWGPADSRSQCLVHKDIDVIWIQPPLKTSLTRPLDLIYGSPIQDPVARGNPQHRVAVDWQEAIHDLHAYKRNPWGLPGNPGPIAEEVYQRRCCELLSFIKSLVWRGIGQLILVVRRDSDEPISCKMELTKPPIHFYFKYHVEWSVTFGYIDDFRHDIDEIDDPWAQIESKIAANIAAIQQEKIAAKRNAEATLGRQLTNDELSRHDFLSTEKVGQHQTLHSEV